MICLKPPAKFFLSIFTCLIFLFLGSTNIYAADSSNLSFESEVINLTNTARRQNNLPTLNTSIALTQAARIHNQTMENCLKNYSISLCFQHTVTIISEPVLKQRLINQGYIPIAWAENHAWGQTTPLQVFNAWMGSFGHRGNILSSNYTDIGCGYLKGVARTWWTCDFAKGSGSSITPSPSPTPSPSSSPKPSISPSSTPPPAGGPTSSPNPTINPTSTPQPSTKPYWCQYIPTHRFCL